MKCPAVLMLVGEAYPCDWPTDEHGRHDGWAHSNMAAQAIWCGDEGPSHEIQVQDGDPIQGEVVP